MAIDKPFAPGDEVFVCREPPLSSLLMRGPFKITKRHKGNGNLIVDGIQYHSSGETVSMDYSVYKLVHADPATKTEQRRLLDLNDCYRALQKIDLRGLMADEVQELQRLLKKIVVRQAEETKS